MSKGYVEELMRLYHRMRRSFLTQPTSSERVRIGVLRCSDGRSRTFNRALGVKPGRLFDMRSVGAVKTILSYEFRDRVIDWLAKGGEHYVFLLTYHEDCLERSLGCKGFTFDRDAALVHQQAFASEIWQAFDGRIQPLVVGFDTRLEQLKLHGFGLTEQAFLYSLSLIEEGVSHEKARRLLTNLWPGIDQPIIDTLLPMLLHNAAHVGENIENQYHDRMVNHEEVGLVIGRRVGWIVDEDDALQAVMIEDTTMDPVGEIGLGIQLLKDNFASGRIPRERGAFVLVSIPYFERQNSRSASQVAAKGFARMARTLVQEQAPEIAPHLTWIVGVISEETRQFQVIEGSEEVKDHFTNASFGALLDRSL